MMYKDFFVTCVYVCIIAIVMSIATVSLSIRSRHFEVKAERLEEELVETNCMISIYKSREGILPITLDELEEEKEKVEKNESR